MKWTSFSTGVFFASCLLIGLWAAAPQVPPVWRQCAPAQDGEVLVTTSQYKEHTECNYAKKTQGRVIQRKKVVS